MKSKFRNKFTIILTLGLILSACGKSKQAQFYMLNPIPPKIAHNNQFKSLKIGMDAIRAPAFTEKPQLMIYDGFNRVQLEEFHQWAESLDKNISRVIKTNLDTLLPGVRMEDAPWNIEFKPDYNLQVVISEFKIDIQGNSSLRADYTITHLGKSVRKYDKFYYQKVSPVTVECLVKSMNSNLNHLSRDIAKSFKGKK